LLALRLEDYDHYFLDLLDESKGNKSKREEEASNRYSRIE
jgi:hypothetical protein